MNENINIGDLVYYRRENIALNVRGASTFDELGLVVAEKQEAIYDDITKYYGMQKFVYINWVRTKNENPYGYSFETAVIWRKYYLELEKNL